MSNEIGASAAGSTRQALVSSIVQDVISEKAQLLPLVTDYSGQAQPGSQSLGIPRRNSFSASDKAYSTDVNHSQMTFGVDTITFAHKYVSAKIEDIAKVQSVVDVPGEVVKEIGEAMARAADDLILTALKDVSLANPDMKIPLASASDDKIALADITNARKLLRSEGKVMFDGDTYLLVSPEQEQELLSISNLIDASKYGDSLSIKAGEIGSVMGFRVVVSDLLTADQAIAFHKSAVAFASQQNFKLEFDRDLSNLSDHYVGSGLMGATALAEGKRSVFFGDGH